MIKNCQQCQKVFSAEREWNKFCSQKCWQFFRHEKAMRDKIEQCEFCDETFVRNSIKGNRPVRFCSVMCRNLAKKTPEYRAKLSGKLYNWYRTHGFPEPNRRTQNGQDREWRNLVMKRDNHQCVECGAIDNLEVDHIKPYAAYPDLRHDVSNGRVLCRSCHVKTDTYGIKTVIIRKSLTPITT